MVHFHDTLQQALDLGFRDRQLALQHLNIRSCDTVRPDPYVGILENSVPCFVDLASGEERDTTTVT